MSMIIELHHPTDPRWLIVDEIPNEVTMQDLMDRKYGKLLIFCPGQADAIYHKDDESETFVLANKKGK